MNIQALNNKRVIFIDLDGTLIEPASGDTFPRNLLDFKIKDDVVQKLEDWSSMLAFIQTTNNLSSFS